MKWFASCMCIQTNSASEVSLRSPHLSQSGGTFIEARLTWVRLNAELKNWRNVGRESLDFLEKSERKEDFRMWTNGARWRESINIRQWRKKEDDRKALNANVKRQMARQELERGKVNTDTCWLWHLGQNYITQMPWKGEFDINHCQRLKGISDQLFSNLLHRTSCHQREPKIYLFPSVPLSLNTVSGLCSAFAG